MKRPLRNSATCQSADAIGGQVPGAARRAALAADAGSTAEERCGEAGCHKRRCMGTGDGDVIVLGNECWKMAVDGDGSGMGSLTRRWPTAKEEASLEGGLEVAGRDRMSTD